MFKFIINWFTGKPIPGTTAPAVSTESAPYKIEPPQTVKIVNPTPVAIKQLSTTESKNTIAPKPKKPSAKKATKKLATRINTQ